MKENEFLLQLVREQLTDEQIREEIATHYGNGSLEQAKWDLKTKVPCCMSSALLACEKLENIASSRLLGNIAGGG